MAKRKGQKSSCPKGWIKSGLVIPLKNPSRELYNYVNRAIGQDRFVYNLAVRTHRFHRKNRLPWPSAVDLAKALNHCKKEDYPFLLECSKFVAQGALRNFEHAIKNWLDPELPHDPPKLKKRKETRAGSFLAASGVSKVKYDGNYRLTLPRIGSVKLLRHLPANVIPYEVHLKRENGKLYAAINFYQPPVQKPDPETQSVGGLDVGINPLTSWTDDQGHSDADPNPKAYYQAQDELRRWQRIQSRRVVGSCGWRKAQKQIDKLHRRIKNVRTDAHHKASKAAIIRHHTLGIESLNVRGMLQSRYQAKALSDAALSGLLNKIRYKAERYGTTLVLADQWYPSSKTCADCGQVNKALGREKEWTCPTCGQHHDRNHNAARNLLKLALGTVRPEVTTGESSSSGCPRSKPPAVKLETKNPELNPVSNPSLQLRLIA